MAKKQDKPWQYTFSTALAAATLLLVLGYFVQSFIEIRKVKPVSVAVERIKAGSGESTEISKSTTSKKEVKQDTKNEDDLANKVSSE
jgi:hypothetical protein